MRDLTPEEQKFARKRYYEKHDGAMEEINNYMDLLRKIVKYNIENSFLRNLDFTGEGLDPVEKITVEGREIWGLIIDFEPNKFGSYTKIYIEREYWR